MAKQWHGGKGDQSRVSDIEKFNRNMEKIYEKKGWKFWMLWEGRDPDKTSFDDSDLSEYDKISYKEFIRRLKNK